MMDLPFDDLMDVARAAAFAGGEELLAYFGQMPRDYVQRKALGDYASKADLAAETAIASVLAKAGGEYGFLGEETGIKQPDAALRWVVDPLDGTSNFIWGIPYFAVSIALCDDDGEILGIVYDPLRREMFTAMRGKGAALNGARLAPLQKKQPQDAIISMSMPVRGQLRAITRKVFFQALDEATNETAGVRRLGSAALDLAYVAAGRLDGYFEDGLSYYDYAAGKLLAQENGALVTSVSGDIPKEGGSLLAGPALIHSWLGEILLKTV